MFITNILNSNLVENRGIHFTYSIMILNIYQDVFLLIERSVKMYKDKLVRITTIYEEVIICIVKKENKYEIIYFNDFGQGYIPKDEIKNIDILGNVI